MSTKDVADALVALWREGKFRESGEQFWAADVVSIEPGGPEGMDPVAKGVDAVRAKSDWWAGAHETHAATVSEPSINGDQFIVSFEMDVTQRQSGQRFAMKEQALYTLRDGKIAEERFFYAG